MPCIQVAGCTQISAGRWTPAGLDQDMAGQFVCHFAHPIEFSLDLRDGAALETPVKWTFATAPARIREIEPQNSAINVPLETGVRVIFNTPVLI